MLAEGWSGFVAGFVMAPDAIGGIDLTALARAEGVAIRDPDRFEQQPGGGGAGKAAASGFDCSSTMEAFGWRARVAWVDVVADVRAQVEEEGTTARAKY